MKTKKNYLPVLLIVVGIVVLATACAVLFKGKTGNIGSGNANVTPAPNETATPAQDNHTLVGEENEILINEGDAQQEAGLRSMLSAALPFAEGDDKVCAIAYMGSGAQAQEQNLVSFFQTYLPDSYQQYLDSLKYIDYGGGECYLIIPRYEESSISLNCMEMSDDGKIRVKKTDAMDKGAFVLYCNPSELYANAEIQIRYREQTFVLIPRLSAVDGRLEQLQVALDLTQEQAYQTEEILSSEEGGY